MDRRRYKYTDILELLTNNINVKVISSDSEFIHFEATGGYNYFQLQPVSEEEAKSLNKNKNQVIYKFVQCSDGLALIFLALWANDPDNVGNQEITLFKLCP